MTKQAEIELHSPNAAEGALVTAKASLPANPTEMDLLGLALTNNSAIDVIERIAALREKAVARDAEIQFNDAMNAAQNEIGRVAPNADNPQTHSRYATYAALDKVLRPIYVKHGFSLSFNSAEPVKPEILPVLCTVSHRAGHSRLYRIDMPADGKGAKGGDVMTKTHATGSAMQYGMRYLLKAIFNVAIGVDDDGNDADVASNGELSEQIEFIQNASDPAELKKLYANAYEKFEASPAALKVIIAARKARKEEMGW